MSYQVKSARCLLLISLLAVVWMATLSSWQPLNHISDKLRHGVAFLLLAGLIFQSFQTLSTVKRLWLIAILALSIECLQLLTPNREFHWDDFAASFAGGVTLELILFSIGYFQANQKNKK